MDERGNITQASLKGATCNWNYGSDGYLDEVNASSNHHYKYSFDSNTGNLNWRQNYLRSLREDFDYDNLDRLTDVTKNGAYTLQLNYSNNGNINHKSDAGDFEYNITGKPFTVSDIDNYTSNFPTVNQNIDYTSFGKIEDISEGNYSAEFKYNADQQRVKMQVKRNGSSYRTKYYFGSSYEKEIGGITDEFIWIGGSAYNAVAVARITNGGTPQIYSIYRDHLGTMTNLVKGSTKVEYNFDAYGRRRDKDNWSYTLSGESALFAGRGFTGHEHLTEFGLINMNGRLYDPLVGRFLSPDNYVQSPDFTQSFNRYGYCLNNPLKYTDPSGEVIGIDDAIVIGAIILVSSAINVASNWDDIKENGGWWSGRFWSYTGLGAVGGIGICTGQPWLMGVTSTIQSGGNKWIDDGELTGNEMLEAGFDGLTSWGFGKLTLPNTGKSPFGLKYSTGNLNLTNGPTQTLMDKGLSKGLSHFIGDQLINYPYTFATSSLKYSLFEDNKNLSWYNYGFRSANAQFITNGVMYAGVSTLERGIQDMRFEKMLRMQDRAISQGHLYYINDHMLQYNLRPMPNINLVPYIDSKSPLMNSNIFNLQLNKQ